MPRGAASWLMRLILLLVPSAALAQGYAPTEAANRMTAPDGIRVQLFASEPMIRQPSAIEFDDRGRLWVIQYLQYPNPAGLRRVKVDRYSRTVYDAVPPPPPKGPRGADRITILEDTNGDGTADRAHDFVNGMNLASGLAFGHGGVFVLQIPYLLFYPDRDRDDRPDGDPEVLLSGFGMEDAHSVANSLTWGPDGWLYGLQGSTVTARVRGIEFQQGVWRYHPVSRRFELFCEGGGNMWGLDFDPHGNLFASTNVGGSLVLHAVQGAYCWKSFGKHGPLHNPYTYGYFDHVVHQASGEGHVTVGGLFYLADAFPARFRGQFISGDLLGHSVHWSTLAPRGSTFTSRHAGDLLVANDTWFAPTDLTLGPDGCVYVTDWHDQRTAHPDPDADWDRSNGRIYAIRPQIPNRTGSVDLASKSSVELVGLLGHPNSWYARRARRLLIERHEAAVRPRLQALAFNANGGQPGLEAFWALTANGGLNPELAARFLAHPREDIRAGTVRLLGDDGTAPRSLLEQLLALARTDRSVRVRSQLASTARRLPAADGLTLASSLARRDVDGDDPHIPLLLWWAVEHHALTDVETTLTQLASPDGWRSQLVRETLLPRLIRRYAAEGSEAAESACARVLASAPSDAARASLSAALDEGLSERRAPNVVGQSPLAKPVNDLWRAHRHDATLTRAAARLGNADAAAEALRVALERGAAEAERVDMLVLIGALPSPAPTDRLLPLVLGQEPAAVQSAALRVLGRDAAVSVADTLLDAYANKDERWRAQVREALLSRKSGARAFLSAVDRGRLAPKDVPVDSLRVVALHHDQALDRLVQKHWGRVTTGTPEEKLAEVRRLNNDLRAAAGDPARGRSLFEKHCATCHKLFGDGNAIGPDLTHANRQDRDYLLVSLVDPSAVVRKEFESVVVSTKDGRILTGLLGEQTPAQITIVGARNERTTLARNLIDDIADSPVSLMPENLYRALSPAELRDLFAYLQSPPRLNSQGETP
jgi:putative membrane-bound dehydrogenase-like protein